MVQAHISGSYVSADCHVVEPVDLFTTRMDKGFRERAPRYESRPDNDYCIIDGMSPYPLGYLGAGGRLEEIRPGCWEPDARLSDQDLDHIRAEVMYPALMGQIQGHADPDYARECIRVYNDWLGEFSAAAPNRFLGVGILPLSCPIEQTLEEAEQIAKRGLRSVLLPIEIKGGWRNQPNAQRMWAALQDLGLPVAFHIATAAGRDGEVQGPRRSGGGPGRGEDLRGCAWPDGSDLLRGASGLSRPSLRDLRGGNRLDRVGDPAVGPHLGKAVRKR